MERFYPLIVVGLFVVWLRFGEKFRAEAASLFRKLVEEAMVAHGTKTLVNGQRADQYQRPVMNRRERRIARARKL
jgi:hypothetical protein